MAVRHFDYEQAKNTMTQIQNQADNVKKYLANCQSIVNENVGVQNRWTGQRATAFKQKWEKSAAEFNEFVEMINQYASKIDESYRVHQSFDQGN